ncbi:hypothetical protein Ae201684P_004275 [Aphanomyces euteiches]|nr:hypothetical protein Ae201684P_004275 [Aphanomyces euteiches]
MPADVFSLLYLLSALPGILCLFGVLYNYVCRLRDGSDMAVPLLDQNFLNFMPGIDRRELEELLTDEERWTCIVCAFGNLATDATCNLCGAPPTTNLDDVTLTSRQRTARRRRQWTRRINDDGNVQWVQQGDPSQLNTAWRIFSTVDHSSLVVVEEHIDGMTTRPINQWPDMSKTELQLHCVAVEDDNVDVCVVPAAHRRDARPVQPNIKADRSRLFEDAVTELLDLKGPLRCAVARHQFEGEAAIDAGAVQREWYTLVSHAFLAPERQLFQVTNRSDNSYFVASHCSDVDDSRGDLFRVVGRFIGRALLDGQVIPMHLNPIVFNAILGLPIVFEDLEDFDPTVCKSLAYVLECDNVDELALTFSASTVDGDGAMVQVDLIENGRQIAVENHNRVDFVQAMVRHLIFGRVERHLAGLIQGLYDIVPPELLLVFDHKELELILCGLPVVDVVDWKLNTVTTANLRNHQVTDWFWQVVEAMESRDQGKLLQISTGASRVPVQGFKGLTSYDGRICYFTLKGVKYKVGAYPVVHACFNRIDLPLYPTKELLEDALRMLLLSDPTGFNTV